MQKYFFKPIGELSNFDWQYEQHAAVVLPDGDIMLFDNGHFRSKDPKKRIPNSQNFSRGVRYRIDTQKMEIKQIWQYGKERGAEFFSPYICNVEYYDEGHYMAVLVIKTGKHVKAWQLLNVSIQTVTAIHLIPLRANLSMMNYYTNCKYLLIAIAPKNCPFILLMKSGNPAKDNYSVR